MANKNIIWIVIGVLVAVGVIYLLVTTDLTKLTQNNQSQENPGKVGDVLVPGTSAVSDKGEVLGANGQVAKNDAEWGTSGAPQQSGPLDVKSLTGDTVKIGVVAGNFTPNSFKAKAGKAVVVSLTSNDNFTHSFHFSDVSLKALAIGVGPGETRAITFNAPNKKGDYQFFCDLPGHRDRGEVGTMIVE
ncbi:MAG: cupredoxin domain-containing protein [bacterium]|nr:cupredoxin domain-containing protein [bacterium]